MKIQTRLRGAAAPLAISLALVAQPAFGQEAGAAAEEQEEGTEDGEQPESSTPTAGNTIVVTGSRIRRDEFSAPAPITIVDPELERRSGSIDTAEIVQGSPIAAGSAQITSAISSNFVTNGGSGAQTISLRGLGAERTLVLLNGRRAGPAGTRGAVSAFDLNVLPQAIMERVDILKDGASSIYGSDAVAGVVNLITKTDTDGLVIDVFGSVPFQSGGERFSASATWGKEFDRGHILISGSYDRTNELARGDRSYLGCPENYVFTDETFSTRADLIDPRSGEYSCQGSSGTTWGHVWTYDYSYYYSPNGTNVPGSAGVGDVSLIQFDYPGDNLGQYIPEVGTRLDNGQLGIPPGWFAVSYDGISQAVLNTYHPLMDQDTIIPETDRYTVYVDAAYDITDNVEAYAELLFNKRKNFINASGQVWQFGFGESADGLFGFGTAGDPFANGFTGPALYSPTAFRPDADSSVEVDYYRAVGGFRGEIGSAWSWDLYGQWSKSDGNYSNNRVLQDSIDTQDFRGVFVPADCTGTTTPIGGKACVPVDWYSARVMFGDFTPEEAEFLFEWETGNTEYTQWYVEGVVSGELFELPGGPVGVALGGTYRQDEINDVPGEITLAGNAWQAGGAGITAGKTDTLEAFGEIELPIISDVPGIQAFTIRGAGRVTNVKATRASDGLTDEDNGNWTYKIGADWEVTDWLRFRGTYGTSFRAPALFEQFLADQEAGLSQRAIDPCIQWGFNLAQGNISQRFADNCAADGVAANHTGAGIGANIITGGGIGVLDPETSTAWTASAIFTPRFDFLPNTRISLAIDYFDIEVNGEIAQLGAANILSQCYASDFFPNDPVCGLFVRIDDIPQSDPDWNAGNASNVARVRDSFINVNSQKNRGVDVTATIRHDFGGGWDFQLRSQMTWQTEDQIALFDGFFEDNNGESGEPIWVGDFRAQLSNGPWSIFYGLDVVGGTDDTEDYLDASGTLCPTFVTLGNVCLKLTTEATFYHSTSVTREINDNFTVTAGITNLFDTRPPRVSDVGGNGILEFGKGVFNSQYDLLGRRAFVNVNFKY